MAKKTEKPLKKKKPHITKQFAEEILAKLSPFMNPSLEGFAILDENLNLIHMNPAAEKMLGVASEALRGMNLAEIVPDIRGTGRYDRYLDVLKTGESYFLNDLVSHTKFGDVHLRLKAFRVGNWLGVVTSVITERKRAEQALRESEERFRLIYQQALFGYQSLNEDGYVLEVNQTWLDTFGYSREEVIGRWFGDFLAPRSTDEFQDRFSRFKASGEIRGIEFDMLKKDGSIVTVSFDGKIGYDEQGQFEQTHCILQDITARKRAKVKEQDYTSELSFLSMSAAKMLELSPKDDIYGYIGERLKELAGNAVVIINSFDGATDRFHLRSTVGIGGKEKEIDVILGKHLTELTTPISDEAILGLTKGKLEKVAGGIFALAAGGIPEVACKEIENLLDINEIYAIGCSQKGELFGSAVMLMRKGAELRNPRLIEIFMYQAALALQRWQAEESLRESEEYFRALIENAHDAIVILSADGTIRYESPVVERLWGYKEEDWSGKDYSEFVHPDDMEKAAEVFAELLENPGSNISTEICVRHKDGLWSIVEANAQNLVNNQAVGGIVVNIRDITKRKKAEEALQERMRFETLLSDLSAAFINLPYDKVEEGVVLWLQRVVEFLEVDRSTILELLEDETKIHPTLSYAAPGIETIPPIAIDELFPWYTDKIHRGETLIIENIDDLPEEAQNEKAYAVLAGMKSNLTIPLKVGGKIMGAIAFGAFKQKRYWDKGIFSRLRLIGEIFASALLRKRAEEALRRNEQTIREMAQEAAKAHEEERQRLALEVHDRISQNLAAAFYQIKMLENYPFQEAAAKQALLRASALMKECIGESRNIMEDLYSPVLSDFGLIAVIDNELRRFQRDTGVEVKFHAICPLRLPLDAELNIYRIFREALSNIRRHATGAKNVEVSLVCEDSLASLMVCDDGCGYDVEAALLSKKVGGMAGMRRRAEIAGGTCIIESVAGKGTTVSLTLPYKPAAEPEQHKS